MTQTHQDIVERVDQIEGGMRLRGMWRFDDMRSVVAAVNVRRSSDEAPLQIESSSDIEERAAGQAIVIEGVASSTGVDSYGTEMSLAALRSMERQFRKGVAYAPIHAEREWHEVAGITVAAEVRRVAAVVNAADDSEPAYVLLVRSHLDPEHARSRQMERALDSGMEIGQSIGGWFTELRVFENAQGEIERIIIDDVLLDHLAATRGPSNGDSTGLTLRERVTAELPTFEARLAGVAPDTRSALPPSTDPADREDPEVVADEREVTSFADLPVEDDVEVEWDWDTETQDEVLGDEDDPDWERYRRAHLWYDPENAETKTGYKLPIARMVDGELTVIFRAVAAAIGAINGARGGVDISDEDRADAYDHAVRYYEKFSVEPPPFQEELSDSDPEARATANTDSSESSGDAPPTQGDEMTEEKFRAVLGEVVTPISEQVRSFGERLDALEGDRSDDREPKTKPEERSEPPAAQSTAELDDLRAQLAEEREAREAAQAERDAAKERAERDAAAVERMIGHSIRETQAYQTGALHDAIELSMDGDMSALVERAEKEGNAAHLVHVTRKSRALKRINDLDLDEGRTTFSEGRRAMRDLVRAAVRDGFVTPPKSTWRR